MILGVFAGLRAVWARFLQMFKNTEPGFAFDFSDLTEEKLAWRRNLFSETEFRNGPSDAPVRGTGVTATTMAGYDGALLFANLQAGDYAYKTMVLPIGTVVSFQCVVEMGDDNGPPVLGGNSAGVDASMVVFGQVFTGTVTALGGRFYRITIASQTVNITTPHYGVCRYGGNSSRTLKATAYQVEIGAPTAYQRFTDIAREFLAAFPKHALFQDALGAMPVYFPDQSCGLVLDLRLAGVRGPELWSNPILGTNWVDNGNGSYTHTAGASSNLNVGSGIIEGRWYEISFVISGRTGGNIRALAGASSSGVYSPMNSGLYRTILRAAGTGHQILNCENAFAGTVSNISYREIPGNHLVQYTAAARPVVTGRANLFYYSNADAMTAAGSTPPTVAVRQRVLGENCTTALFTSAAPTGYAGSRVEGGTGALQTWAPAIKGGMYVWSMRICLSRALSGGEALYVYVTGSNGLAQYNINATNSAAFVGKYGTAVGVHNVPITAGGTLYPVIFVSGALTSDLLVAVNSATLELGLVRGPYQLTGGSNEWYAYRGYKTGLRFNGAAHWMQIPALDMTAYDKFVFTMALKKETDEKITRAVEIGNADTAGTPGSFYIAASGESPAVNGYRVSCGGATNQVSMVIQSLPAPHNAVLTVGVDWSAATMETSMVTDVNNVSRTGNVGNGAPGAANGINAPFYFGMRGGSSLAATMVAYRASMRMGAFHSSTLGYARRWSNDLVKFF